MQQRSKQDASLQTENFERIPKRESSLPDLVSQRQIVHILRKKEVSFLFVRPREKQDGK